MEPEGATQDEEMAVLKVQLEQSQQENENLRHRIREMSAPGMGQKRQSILSSQGSPRTTPLPRRLSVSWDDSCMDGNPQALSGSSLSPCSSDGNSPRFLASQDMLTSCVHEIETLKAEIANNKGVNDSLLREERKLDDHLQRQRDMLEAWESQLAHSQRAVTVEQRKHENIKRTRKLQKEAMRNEEREFEIEKRAMEKKRAEWAHTLADLEKGYEHTKGKGHAEVEQLQTNLRHIKLERANSNLSNSKLSDGDAVQRLKDEKASLQMSLKRANADLNKALEQHTYDETIILSLRELHSKPNGPPPAVPSSGQLEELQNLKALVAEQEAALREYEGRADLDSMLLKKFREDLNEKTEVVEKYKETQAELVEAEQLAEAVSSNLTQHLATAQVDIDTLQKRNDFYFHLNRKMKTEVDGLREQLESRCLDLKNALDQVEELKDAAKERTVPVADSPPPRPQTNGSLEECQKLREDMELLRVQNRLLTEEAASLSTALKDAVAATKSAAAAAAAAATAPRVEQQEAPPAAAAEPEEAPAAAPTPAAAPAPEMVEEGMQCTLDPIPETPPEKPATEEACVQTDEQETPQQQQGDEAEPESEPEPPVEGDGAKEEVVVEGEGEGGPDSGVSAEHEALVAGLREEIESLKEKAEALEMHTKSLKHDLNERTEALTRAVEARNSFQKAAEEAQEEAAKLRSSAATPAAEAPPPAGDAPSPDAEGAADAQPDAEAAVEEGEADAPAALVVDADAVPEVSLCPSSPVVNACPQMPSAEVEELTKQVELYRTHNASLRHDMQEKEASLANAIAERDAARKALEEAGGAPATSAPTPDTPKPAVEGAEGCPNCDALTEQVEGLNASVEVLKHDLQQQRESLSTAVTSKDVLDRNSSTKIGQLKQELRTLQEEADASKASAKQARQQVSKLEEALRQANDRVREVEPLQGPGSARHPGSCDEDDASASMRDQTVIQQLKCEVLALQEIANLNAHERDGLITELEKLASTVTHTDATTRLEAAELAADEQRRRAASFEADLHQFKVDKSATLEKQATTIRELRGRIDELQVAAEADTTNRQAANEASKKLWEAEEACAQAQRRVTDMERDQEQLKDRVLDLQAQLSEGPNAAAAAEASHRLWETEQARVQTEQQLFEAQNEVVSLKQRLQEHGTSSMESLPLSQDNEEARRREAELMKSQSEVLELQRTLTDMQEATAAAERRVAEMSTLMKESVDKTQQLQDQLSTTQREQQEASAAELKKLAQAQCEAKLAQEETVKLQGKITDLEQKLREGLDMPTNDHAVAEAAKKLWETEELLARAQKRCTEAEAQVEELKQRVEVLEKEGKPSVAAVDSESDRMVAEAAKKLWAAEDALKQAEQQLEEERAARTSAEAACTQLQAELEAAAATSQAGGEAQGGEETGAVLAVQEQLRAAEAALEASEQAARAAKAEEACLRDRVQGLEAQLQERVGRHQVESLEVQLAQSGEASRHQLEEMQSKLAETSSALQQEVEKHSSAQRLIETLQVEAATVRAQMQTHREGIMQSNSESSSLQQRLREAEAARDAASAEAVHSSTTLSHLRQDHAALRSQLDTSERQRAASAQEAANSKAALQAAEMAASSARDSATRQQREVVRLQSRYDEQTTALRVAEALAKEATSEKEARDRETETMNKEWDTVLQELDRKTAEKDKEIDALRKELAELKGKLAEALREREVSLSRSSADRRERDALRERLKDAQESHELLQRSYDDAVRDRRRMHEGAQDSTSISPVAESVLNRRSFGDSLPPSGRAASKLEEHKMNVRNLSEESKAFRSEVEDVKRQVRSASRSPSPSPAKRSAVGWRNGSTSPPPALTSRLSTRRHDWESKHLEFEDNVSLLKVQLEGLSDAMKRSNAAAHHLSDKWGSETSSLHSQQGANSYKSPMTVDLRDKSHSSSPSKQPRSISPKRGPSLPQSYLP